MKRKVLFLCTIMIFTAFITGCWNRREMNDLAIAVGLSIDKSGDQYEVGVQVVEPGAVSGKTGTASSPVTLYHASAYTIQESLRKITTVSPRKIYGAHLRILVLGEGLAKEGVGKALDFIIRDSETRNDFFVIVAKNTNALDTLKILTNLEKVPAVRLYSSLLTSEQQWAPTATVKLDKLVSELVSEGKHPVLTGVEIIGDRSEGNVTSNVETVESPSDLKYSGLSVFKGDKLIGWLNEEESKAYNYIDNQVKGTIGFVNCPDGGRLALEVVRSNTKVNGSMHNERPRIDIEIETEANVSEVQCRIDLTKTENITMLEKLASQKIEEFIEGTITKVKEEYKVDIFGFGEVIHRSNPKAWKTLKTDWDQTFVNIPVNVQVKYTIQNLGKISNSFLQKMKD